MATLLILIIIYLCFICLGLPDSILGVSWPLAHTEMNADPSLAGLITMVIALGSFVSSLFSSKLAEKFGTQKVAGFSIFLTSLGVSAVPFIHSVHWYFVIAVPLGVGAGAVDAVLNSYVTNNFKAIHLNWLHCFWGVGAMIGPALMSVFIKSYGNWRLGYTVVGIVLGVLAVVILLSFPIWKRFEKERDQRLDLAVSEEKVSKPDEEKQRPSLSILDAVKKRGAFIAALAFGFYCSIEICIGLWGASFLINVKEITPADAALWVSLNYAGIMAGRFVCGLLTLRVKDDALIRVGMGIVIVGVILLILPLPSVVTMLAMFFIGLGCAPVYPGMIHVTPDRFGTDYSASVIGLEVAIASFGAAVFPIAIGLIATKISFSVIPYLMLAFAVLTLVCFEVVKILTKKPKAESK